MKPWLQKNAVEMYSKHKEGKSAVAAKFIRALTNNNYKHMTSIPKNVYNDKLDDVVTEYNNTYHTIIKMKPVHVNLNMLVDLNKENNK